MRNTLILIEQIQEQRGGRPRSTITPSSRPRCSGRGPSILTALAAVLAFIPLTHSVFWGSMAYTLIGGTAVGTLADPALPAGALRHLVPRPGD